MYRCSRLVYIDVQRDETDLESLPDIHILSPDIFCGNKNLPADKMSGMQIESCAEQNRILTFSARQMSDVRRYFKAYH